MVEGRRKRDGPWSDWTAAREPWPAARIFIWAGAIGLVMSTEFFAQPFVWRSWTLDDILLGWLPILADRLVVAGAMAACMVAAGWRPARSLGLRGAQFALAALAGATAGEGLRRVLHLYGERDDLAATLGRIAAWTLAGSALGGIVAAWRFGADYAATAEAAQMRAARLRQLTTATQLEALQRQIEPHFLFNTLATIKRLGVTSPREGRQLLSRFLDFTTATLSAEREAETTLGQELDLAKAYLDVCAARMGERLTVVWDVDEAARDRRFPALMLGTLLENALKHGLAPVEAGGTITVSARRRGPRLEVAVADSGSGLTGQASGAGIGLANLVARLRLLYGPAAAFALEPQPQGGVRAVIGVPDALAA
ncbi:histidine kinase [Phenylobacterium sp.]|uniref:sensor histidine kinase n=1 Tax=Phenylobacterium sp. TaxID=1871053 RepID=UPI0012200362|nr:histidine kinase [Phenylobacterium sp.]THD62871.1 MAG: sensor histidine kinase [Phenylobacterium sp.]